MKKFLVASSIAAIAMTAVAFAQSYQFNTNLTIGSTGPDVSALQTALIAAGYDIPAVSSGAAAKGYFGSQTQSAVKLYQAAKSIPNTGFVGPLTRAALNAGGVAMNGTTTMVNCPAGYTCTSTTPAPVVTCPAGYTCTASNGTTVTGTGSAGITTPGVAGTLAVSLWTTPSGVTAYKGQAYDLAGYKLQAGSSDMAVSSVALDFDTRLWLYASAITIHDETGKVVGQVSNLSASNFAELTVGSDYRITVPISNLVVKATQSKYLTVNVSFVAVTDRQSNPSLNVLSAQVRSVDGTGVTDTETATGGSRLYSYQSTNIAQLVVTSDNASPASGVIQVSTAAQTQNVPLAIFDIKSSNQPATLQNLIIALNLSTSTLPIGSLLSNLQISVGSLTYSASSLSTTSATFSNLSIPLPADQYVPIKVLANLAQDTNNTYDNVSITTTLNTSAGTTVNGVFIPTNVTAVDGTYNNITSNQVTLTSNAQSFSATGVNATNLAVTPSSVTANQGASSTQTLTYSYSLTAGNNPVYVSKTYATAVTATTTGTPGILFTNASFRDSDSTNDGTTYFYVAPGQTKTFTSVISAVGKPGNAGTYSINALNYGTGTSGTGGVLNASTIGNTLYATVVF